MSLTGTVSFFDRNIARLGNGATATASSNNDIASNVLGLDQYVAWSSLNSDDTTTETLTIKLSQAKAMSRIFLVGTNAKAFQITYGSTPTAFANVEGIDGSLTGIDVTGYDRKAAYFEFDEVTTDQINISIDTTQVADEEKVIESVILTNEIGSFVGYPETSGFEFDRNERTEATLSGKYLVEKNRAVAEISFDFDQYHDQPDIDLATQLFDREKSFLIWACGGKPDQFKFKIRGFRIEDVYLMQTERNIRIGYDRNIYINGVDHELNLIEVAR